MSPSSRHSSCRVPFPTLLARALHISTSRTIPCLFQRAAASSSRLWTAVGVLLQATSPPFVSLSPASAWPLLDDHPGYNVHPTTIVVTAQQGANTRIPSHARVVVRAACLVCAALFLVPVELASIPGLRSRSAVHGHDSMSRQLSVFGVHERRSRGGGRSHSVLAVTVLLNCLPSRCSVRRGLPLARRSHRIVLLLPPPQLRFMLAHNFVHPAHSGREDCHVDAYAFAHRPTSAIFRRPYSFLLPTPLPHFPS